MINTVINRNYWFEFPFISILILTLCNCGNANKTNSKNDVLSSDFYKKIDSLNIGTDKVYIELHYSRSSSEYIAEYNNKKYKIPYVFIAGGDTISATNYSINHIDSSQFSIDFFQGNSGLYRFYLRVAQKNLFLDKVVGFDEKANKNTGSVMIQEYLDNLDTLKINKILDFINWK